MDNDESVFVYKTIKNKKPKKILKGTKLSEIRKNLEQEFLKKGLGAYADFQRVNANINGKEQIPVEEPDEEKSNGEGEEEQKEITPEESKIPQLKLIEGDGFIENTETLEYLRKVKFLNIKQRRDEGKTDQQIMDELDDDIGLDAEQKILKSIMKNTIQNELEEESSESSKRKRRKVKASELVKEKRKANEGNLISSNFAMRSGIEIPETQEAKERKLKEEEKKAKGAHWKELMENEAENPDSFIDIGGYLEFKELQGYSREPIVFYKRISNLMVRWIISAGKVFEKHSYYFIPIKIIGSPMSKRSTIIKSTIYLELMKFPKSAIAGKDFETIWPFLLYLLNNWIRHQFNIMGMTDSKELEERIIKRKEKKQREMIEGMTEVE